MSAVSQLAKECNRNVSVIYKLAKKLGRLPTKEEVLGRPTGRPRKYK